MSGIILFILAVVGASGIIAQMVLARELLVSFSGNELALGLVLANWMLAESLGVFLAGRFAAKGKQVALTFAGLQVAFSFFLLIALFVARAYKGMIGVGVGEGLGWWQALWWSFLILLPVAFTHGAMFSIGCQLTVGVKVTYVWETVGTLLGGLLLTYVLLPFISSFQIVLLIAGLGVVALVILFLKRGQRVAMICLLAVGCCLLLGLFKSADILEKTSLKQQWKTGLLLASRNSVYGNIVALKHNNQCTFYYNGVPAITTPHPDAVFIEEMGIVPLLFVDQPKRILVLGSGAGGLLSELLKHPIEKIDYVELDSVLIDLVKTYATPKTTDALYDARVNLVHQDPRLFLKKATEWYDVIIIGTSFSNDYATNRFFTQEFFSLCLKRLDRQGVFALWLPGSPAYLSDEVRDLTGSVVNALKQSGCFVRVIP
ncbi:MAG: hypothetical protein KBA46_02235, partial [Candidatus Omnitrophica bacterium]|nr:hypothetical protein [Candidatus Omnitrophota bacterium]